MTYGPLDGKMTEFVYDCRNRLIKAGDVEYEYDAEDNRIAVTKDGVTTKYVVDSNCEYSQVLTATTGNNTVAYIYGDGLIAQESEAYSAQSEETEEKHKQSSDTENTRALTGYVTYHYNQVGSTTALTNENGNVIETYEYSPYGDILEGDSSLTMFLYNGKYGVASDDNGLYYMRARYYNVSIKRFINQDVVIGHLDVTSSLNRYAYCEGNPISYIDPFGLDRIDTSKVHDILLLLSGVAIVIEYFLPPVGYILSAVVSVADLIVSCFDLGQDMMYGNGEDVLKDLTSILVDILGAVTSIQAKLFKTSKVAGFPDEMFKEYLTKWNRLSNEAVGASTISGLLNDFRDIKENFERWADSI